MLMSAPLASLPCMCTQAQTGWQSLICIILCTSPWYTQCLCIAGRKLTSEGNFRSDGSTNGAVQYAVHPEAPYIIIIVSQETLLLSGTHLRYGEDLCIWREFDDGQHRTSAYVAQTHFLPLNASSCSFIASVLRWWCRPWFAGLEQSVITQQVQEPLWCANLSHTLALKFALYLQY